MKLVFLTTAALFVLLAAFWSVRSYQVNEGRDRLAHKINLAMEGEEIICLKKIDDYSWQEEAASSTQTFGPTLVLYSFKKMSDEEFLFKKILIRGTKKLPRNAAIYELSKYEPLALREMPPCTNTPSDSNFLNYTLGKRAEATLISRYWMLTSIKSDTPGSVADYQSTLSSIKSNGQPQALMFSEKIVYRITERQKEWTSYITDIFASKSSFLDN